MKSIRATWLAGAAFLLGVGTASAQAPAAPPAPRPLPPGLTEKNGVVMMQPIARPVIAKPIYETDQETVPTPEPRLRPGNTKVLSAADHDLYEKAFEAGDRGDWIAARGLADQGHDAIARRIIYWRYLTDPNGGATFDEISRFLRDYPDWPLRHVLFARAEQAMPANLSPSTVIAWFSGRKPETGMGKVRLGDALIATGRGAEGRELIRKAWIEDSFTPTEALNVIQTHGAILTPAVDRARLERLIWRGDLSAARREMSRVGSRARQIAQVRMALRTNPRAGVRMLSTLPAALRDNPGVLFDQARMLRRSGNDDDVPALLIKAPIREMAKINPGHWWNVLAVAAREALKSKSYSTAYRLVAHTGLREGTQFAQAEFLAGWIALRFLHKPGEALEHFRKLATGVTRPISLARAHYWAGRACQAQGRLAEAAYEYRLAADHPETFYGQLALTRLEPNPRLRLRETPAAISRARRPFARDTLVHAIRVLADLGEERFLRLFAVHDAEIHPEAGHVALLAKDLVRMGYRDVAVRVAKHASYEGIDLLPYSHPVIALPRYRGPGAAPSNALVLGLIRQETEFNADAVSRVGARGIMQLMPSTARDMARIAGLPYRRAKLTTNARYNIQLGMTELSTDLAKWDGSYILAAAAYNAGSANVRRWIATYGDPRSPSVDPIDWIEQIPYSETRNYVQRVIENTEVYRARLRGRGQRLEILADLYRPNPPPQASVLELPAREPLALPPGSVPQPVARPDRADATPIGAHSQIRTETAALDLPEEHGLPLPQARPDNMTAEAVAIPTRRPVMAIIPKERPTR